MTWKNGYSKQDTCAATKARRFLESQVNQSLTKLQTEHSTYTSEQAQTAIQLTWLEKYLQQLRSDSISYLTNKGIIQVNFDRVINIANLLVKLTRPYQGNTKDLYELLEEIKKEKIKTEKDFQAFKN
ncbi:MAG: hypothetical protein REH83_00605 [Rickettsiella sp.]|nr:hypothetical protein [Rickettsiella sp.]